MTEGPRLSRPAGGRRGCSSCCRSRGPPGARPRARLSRRGTGFLSQGRCGAVWSGVERWRNAAMRPGRCQVSKLANSDTCPRPTTPHLGAALGLAQLEHVLVRLLLHLLLAADVHQVAQALDVVRVLAVDVLVDLRRVDCEIAADRAIRSSLLVSYAVIFSNICNLSYAICISIA